MKSFTRQLSSLTLLAVFAMITTSTAFAEKKTEIYKWVDENGRTHYAARPGDKSAKKMHLGSRIFHDQNDNDSQADDKETQERAKQCQASRATLAKYKKAPFLYRYDEEKKQKVRLTESEAKDAFLQAEKDVSYWCNPPQETAEAESDNQE